MTVLLIFVLWIVNFGISWWNARAVGKAWVETKVAGGWPRLVAWAGAIMSASGFTWCYLIVLGLLGNSITHIPKGGTEAVPYLPDDALNALFGLGYLMIIVPILGSGVVITLHSWREAIRRRSIRGYAIAGYNSFAQIYNVYNAVKDVPAAIDIVESFFKAKGGSKDGVAKVVILLAILALLGGCITTYYIAKAAMRDAAAEEGVSLRRYA